MGSRAAPKMEDWRIGVLYTGRLDSTAVGTKASTTTRCLAIVNRFRQRVSRYIESNGAAVCPSGVLNYRYAVGESRRW